MLSQSVLGQTEQSKKPRTLSWSPRWVAEAQILGAAPGCLPRWTCRKLAWKWRSQDTSCCSDMACWCCEQPFNLLCHSKVGFSAALLIVKWYYNVLMLTLIKISISTKIWCWLTEWFNGTESKNSLMIGLINASQGECPVNDIFTNKELSVFASTDSFRWHSGIFVVYLGLF